MATTHNPAELPTHPTLLHPRTGAPLRAVGFRKNGDPIWPIMGGDGSEGDANDNDGGGDNQPGDNDGGGDNTGDRGDDRRGDNDRDRDDENDRDNDRDDEDKRVTRANREAQRYRTQLRETETRLDEQGQVLDALRRALTGDEGDSDDEPDAQQLQSSVTTLQTENQSLRAQLAVYDIAGDHEGNPSALLDSRRFTGELDRIAGEHDDLNTNEFRTAVSDAIKSAVERDAKLRADQGSSRGGADLPTGSGEGSGRKPRGLGAAVSSALGG